MIGGEQALIDGKQGVLGYVPPGLLPDHETVRGRVR